MPLGVDVGCKEPFVCTLLLPAHVFRRTIESWRGAVLHRLNTSEGNSILTHCAAKSSSPCGSQRRSKPDRRASVSTLSGRSNSFRGFELASMKFETQRNSCRRGWESNASVPLKRRKLLIPHDGKNDRNGKNGVLCAEIVQKLIPSDSNFFSFCELQLPDVRRRYCSRQSRSLYQLIRAVKVRRLVTSVESSVLRRARAVSIRNTRNSVQCYS